ncbi:flagellar hook-basal body complex FliE family protein [Yersinia pestis PY-101]|nr:flagellar hook-basal body complex FliE family protein [Yersinia pestis PY-101]
MDMGISDDLTGTMLASQKASVAFSAMVQVRNKLTSALDDVMNTAL